MNMLPEQEWYVAKIMHLLIIKKGGTQKTLEIHGHDRRFTQEQ